ncbi:MAG: hypothetical protein VW443_02240 [Pseudomonadales bacterium]
MPLKIVPITKTHLHKKTKPLIVQSALDVFDLEDGALLNQLDNTNLTDKQKENVFFAVGLSFERKGIIAWGYIDYPIDSYFYPIVRPSPLFSGLVVIPEFESEWTLDFDNTIVLWSNNRKLYASEFNQDAVSLHEGYKNDSRGVWNTGDILAELFKPKLTLV